MLADGYKFMTTFWHDFTIADWFGIDAIKDTYKRVMDEWRKDYKYMTELVLVLNYKCWSMYDQKKREESELYADLFYETKDYCYDNFTEEELKYFFEVTD